MPNTLSQQLMKKTIDPVIEQKIINQVADQYKLTGDSRKLLFAIRKAENGSQGKEFGVLNPEAMRFAQDPDPTKSLTIQAMWAAGTIRKRYKGDLKQFAATWAPVGAENDPNNLNKNWIGNVTKFMEEMDGQD